MKLSRRNLFLASSAVITVTFSTPVAQAQLYWDNNGNTTGFGTANGTWAAPTTGNSTQGWSANTTGIGNLTGTTTTTTSDSLFFGNGTAGGGLAAGNITVSGTVDAGNITFGATSGGITLNGGTINLAAATTLTAGNGTNAINGNITGAGTSITKLGTGRLDFGGTNTYAGNLTIAAGTMFVSKFAGLSGVGTTGRVVLGNSTSSAILGVFTGASNWTEANLLSLMSGINTGNGSLRIDTSSSGNWTQGGTAYNLGTLGISKSGSNTLTLNKANTIGNVATTVTGGTLRLENTAALGSSTNVNLSSGTTLQIATAGNFTGISLAMSGATLNSDNAGAAQTHTFLTGNSTVTHAQQNFTSTNGLDTFQVGNVTNSSGGGGSTTLNPTTANLIITGSYSGTSTGTSGLNLGGTSQGNRIDGNITLGSRTQINITKSSSSTWTLSGTNTGANGTINVTGGTLILNKLASLNSGNTTINGGTLGVQVGNSTVGWTTGQVDTFLASANTIKTSGALGIDTSLVVGGSLTQWTAFANTTGSLGNLGLTKLGTGNLTLNQSNTYTGTTTISAGTLQIGDGTANGSIATASNIVNNATLRINRGGALTMANAISGNGTLVKDLAFSDLILSGNNTYTGGTAVNAGRLFVNSATALPTTGNVTVGGTGTLGLNVAGSFTQSIVLSSGATLNVRGAGTTFTNVSLPTAGNVTFNNDDQATQAFSLGNNLGLTGNLSVQVGGGNVTVGAVTLGGNISGGSGLSKTGNGTLILTGGNNTYSGATLVSAGRLQLDGAAAAGTLSTGNLTVGSAGTLGFTAGSASTLDLSGKLLTLGGTIAFDIGSDSNYDALNVGDFTLTGNSSFTFNPIGAITNGGNYTLLTSANTITTGGFTIAGQTVGKLTLAPVLNANSVTLNATLLEGIWNQTGDGNWSNGDANTTAGNWNNYKPTVAGDAALFGSAITGNATITVDSAHSLGYLRFDNANIVTIGNGTSGNLTLDNGASAAQVAVTSGSHVIAENVTLASNVSVVPETGTTLTVSGALSGNKTLQLLGNGTLVLSGANSYTGLTTVSAGTLELGHATNTLADTAAINVNGGILAIGANSDTVGAVTLTSGSITGSSGVLTGSSYAVLSGNISANLGGSGGLTKTTAGTVILSGNNTYTGTTTLTAGTLSVNTIGNSGVASALGNGTSAASNLVFDGGTLQYTGANATSNRAFTINTGKTATIDNAAGSNISFVGANGTATNGALTKTGNGTLTLTGNSTYTGKTIVNAGTLQLNGGNLNNANYAGALDIASGATFENAGSVSQTLSGVVGTGGGALTNSGGGQLILSNSGNAYGTLNVGGGRVFINSSTAALPSAATVNVTGGLLVFGVSGTYNQAIAVSSGAGIAARNATTLGNVTLPGNGTVNFNNDDAATSTLAITNSQALTGNLTIEMGGSRTLAAAIGTVTLSGNISGAGAGLTLAAGKAGRNDFILTLSGTGANTYSGLTTVNAGTLALNKTAGVDAIAGNVSVGNGTLSNTASDQIADTATVTMNAASAKWLLNGQTETIANLDMQSAGTGANNGFSTGANLSGNLNVTGTLTHAAGDITLNSSGVGNQSIITAGTLINTGGTWTFGATNGTQSLVTGSGGLAIGGGSTIAVNASANSTNFISLGGNVTSQADANANTISGAGTLRLNASRTFDVADGAAASDLTISTIVANGNATGGITKTGLGTLTLSGNNSYTGATNVGNGTLRLNSAGTNSAIVTDGNTTTTDILINGGTLELAASEQIGNTGSINMTGGAFNFGAASGLTETIDGFTNSGGVFTTGANTLIGLGNTITWSGGTNTINAGGLVQDAHIVISGGTNTVEGQGNGTTGGVLELLASGTGLEMSNGATLTLNSDALVAGSLKLGGDVSTSGNTTVTIASGGVAVNAGFIDLNGGSRTFTIADGSAATDMAISAGITNGGLTKAGDGTLRLSGVNNYGGQTSINAGTLQVTNGSAISNSGAVVLANNATAKLQLLDHETIGSLAGGALSTVDLDNKHLTVGDTSVTTYSGTIIGGSSSELNVQTTGSGKLTIEGTNTYSGITNIAAGADLRIDGNNTGAGDVNVTGNLGGLGSVAGTVTIASGGTLAPGNGIESLGLGAVEFLAGSTYAYELNSAALNGDLTYSSGTLDIAPTTTLTLTELVSGTLALGSKLTLISYSGGWTGTELFTYLGSPLADDSTFTLGANQWFFNYDDNTAGSNYTADLTGPGFVTMTVIPEPRAALLGGLGLLALLRRRRR